jgi:hypothetical protein
VSGPEVGLFGRLVAQQTEAGIGRRDRTDVRSRESLQHQR